MCHVAGSTSSTESGMSVENMPWSNQPFVFALVQQESDPWAFFSLVTLTSRPSMSTLANVSKSLGATRTRIPNRPDSLYGLWLGNFFVAICCKVISLYQLSAVHCRTFPSFGSLCVRYLVLSSHFNRSCLSIVGVGNHTRRNPRYLV